MAHYVGDEFKFLLADKDQSEVWEYLDCDNGSPCDWRFVCRAEYTVEEGSSYEDTPVTSVTFGVVDDDDVKGTINFENPKLNSGMAVAKVLDQAYPNASKELKKVIAEVVGTPTTGRLLGKLRNAYKKVFKNKAGVAVAECGFESDLTSAVDDLSQLDPVTQIGYYGFAEEFDENHEFIEENYDFEDGSRGTVFIALETPAHRGDIQLVQNADFLPTQF